MTRDDIYDHLARVYLGKRNQSEEQKKKQFNAWLLINIFITIIIFTSAIYGLTAFLQRRDDVLRDRVIFALNKGPIRISYDLNFPQPPVKTFSLTVPKVNASRYTQLRFAIRGTDEGYPGIMRVEVRNRKNEISSVFIENVHRDWIRMSIPLEQFEKISDWSDIEEISFILESWNTDRKKGGVFLDDICFSS